MEAVQLVELLGCEVPLLVELERLVDPRLQVQAVLHPSPVLHLKAAQNQVTIILHSIRDVYPGSRISDPGSNKNKKEGGGIFSVAIIFLKI